MARRALVVGINSYNNVTPLRACVSDAEAIVKRLSRQEDGTPNYDCRALLDRMEDGAPITRSTLRAAVTDLFDNFRGEVVLYFSGHGILTSGGGYLCTTDAEKNDWGLPMQEVVDLAQVSKCSDILIMLDCCHSGDFANPGLLKGGPNPLTSLRENMAVMAASLPSEASLEAGNHGLFTAAVLDALDGGAADHMGYVSASSIYAYVHRRFGAWDQRPVYKSYATGVTIIRQCAPLIDRLKLRELVKLFPTQESKLFLDPEYEPEDENGVCHEPVSVEKVRVAKLLKEYRDAGLLRATEQDEQLYWTARRSHSAELTNRGKEYWWLVAKKKV